MNKYISVQKELANKIMATNIFIKLVSSDKSEFEMQIDLNKSFDILQNFENKYSRFLSNNDLQKFNNSTKGELDEEFLDILNKSLEYFKKSGGIFDIGVLPVLQKEGYVFSKNKGFTGKIQITEFVSINKIKIEGNRYFKPLDLKIDLGGIGKGYINNKVCDFLRSKGYENFVVDTGGDIRFEGKNVEENLDYWIAGITNPYTLEDFAYLKVKNMSIATSGINKRKWIKNNTEKNHLIDIRKKESSDNNHYTCTVLSNSTLDADINAKILFLKDYEDAVTYAEKNNLPFVFVEKNKEIIYSNLIRKFLYED